MSSSETYAQHQNRLKGTQAGLSRAEVMARARNGTLSIGKDAEGNDIFAPAATAVTDLNNLPVQTHNWVDRGIVKSCEGAGHPNHRSYARH